MIVYKGFYILDETDFISHFLKENGKYAVINQYTVDRFDINDIEFLKFKRIIIINNLLNPSIEWECSLPKEQLKKLNELRLKQEKIKSYLPPIEHFSVGQLIFYRNKKGEIVKKHKDNLYDIRIGKEKIEKIYSNQLIKRTDIREKLDTIPENLEYKTFKTEKLLLELSKVRKVFYSYYYNDDDELKYWQLKKELATRPHIKRKQEIYSKTY